MKAKKKTNPVQKKDKGKSKAFKQILDKKKMMSEVMKSLGVAPLGVYHESEVIRIVLDVAGKYNVPTTSPGIKKRNLVDNLDYTDDLLEILQLELDKYVKSIIPSRRVTPAEIDNCDTVGDVVELIQAKTQP
jgi:hypothetical protein